jgi:NAD(P)-dependent dehydrogenase (short-subunit alcohol dehydrogenase family)
MNLSNKRILITGAARGLGRAFAETAIQAGARVAIADVLEDLGKDTARALGADFIFLDLASPQSVEACAQNFVSLDGLVNNAAIATAIGGKGMEEIDIETWDRVMTVNVRGTWLLSKACLPALRASHGKIVNIASDTAMWGAPKLMHYVASKGAVIAMTRAMARELGASGITVNAVAPGLTVVEATESVPAERHRQYVEGRAIKRAQQPEDVCGAVLFLLSDDAAFMTGQVLPVNGGFIMN